MQNNLEMAGRMPCRSRDKRLRDRFCGSLRCFLRHRTHYSRHAREIARGHRQFEVLIDAFNPAEYGLSNPANCLAPAKVFFNAFANHLADPVDMTVQELVRAEQFKQLETIVPVDFEKLSGVQSRDDTPFVMGVDARPLTVLIRSAARACRVYELMTINRPGDVLNYLWLTWIDLGEDVVRQIKGYQHSFDRRTYMKPETPLQELLFPAVERCFWQRGDDASRLDDQWNAVSDQGFWRDQAKAFFAIVQAAQQALRSSPDFLVQRELARIDDGSHPHHFAVSVKREAVLDGVPPDDSTLPELLVSFLTDLVKRDDIRSVSCWENDYPRLRSLP